MHARQSWTPPDDYGYSWLLGFYLGDGARSSAAHVQPRVTLDSRYSEVIEDLPLPCK